MTEHKTYRQKTISIKYLKRHNNETVKMIKQMSI